MGLLRFLDIPQPPRLVEQLRSAKAWVWTKQLSALYGTAVETLHPPILAYSFTKIKFPITSLIPRDYQVKVSHIPMNSTSAP
jgi:hypothetical protein